MRIALLILAASATAGTAFVGTGGGPVRRSPGLWTLEARVEKLEAAGVPGATSAELEKALFGKLAGADRETCVSPEEAAKPVSAADLRIENFGATGCSYARSDVSGGKVDIAGTCRSPADGAERDFTVAGAIGADAMDLLVTFEDRIPAEGVHIRSALRVTGRRTGPCSESSGADWGQAASAANALEAVADVAAAEAEAANALAAGY